MSQKHSLMTEWLRYASSPTEDHQQDVSEMLTFTPAAAVILWFLGCRSSRFEMALLIFLMVCMAPASPHGYARSLMPSDIRPMMCTCWVYLHYVFALNVPFCFQSTMSQPKWGSPLIYIYGYVQADLN